MTTVFPSVQIDTASAYELLMSLAVFSDLSGRQAYELERGWFEEARKSASPELLERIDGLAGSDMPWAHLLSLAHDCPPPRDVPRFLDRLAATGALEIRLHLLGYYVRHVRRMTPPDVILAAAEGDRAAQRELMHTSDPGDDGWQSSLRGLLALRDAEETKETILSILRDWHEQVFHRQEGIILPLLERDAESKRALARTQPAEKVVAAALPGYDYLPESGIEHVLLVPSFVIRPQIHGLDHGDTRIFVYSLADESLAAGGDAPNPRLVRLTRALGDERRLRVLKRLSAGDWTLHELATHFGVGDTTMLHHLIILRGAGLVRVSAGAGKRYELVRDEVPDVGALLETYLGMAKEN